MVGFKSLSAIAALSLVNSAQAWYNELPSCVSPFKPFVYTGCFDNGAPGTKEALSLRSDLDQNDMTVEKCVAHCKGNSYRLAGLSYYGVCYCGNTVSTALLPEDQCTFPCSGDSTETCGGDTQINIWMDPTFPSPEDQTDISEYAPVGCWTDDSSQGRALFYRQDNLASSEMTNEKCLKSCLDGGFPFAGTEYGGECYCGVVIGNGTALATDESTCNMPCNGDSSQTCGGPARLSLYVAKDLQSLEPCGSPSNTSSTTTGYPTTTTTKGYPTSPTKTTTKSTTKATTSSPSTTKTTTKVTTTTTAPVCTATTVIPSDCEWKIGKWCSDPVPDWDDKKDCLISGSKCLLQGTSCFLKAGLPGALSCFKYKEWCVALDLYCVTKCIGKYCDKAGFIEKSPPYGLPPTTSTSTYPCPTTVTTTTKTTTTPPPYPTDDCPPPNPTGICIQPTNKWFGYGPGKPVGGIELPVVTCNNIWGDWKNGNIFKLYTDKDSKKCPSYPVYQFPNACADACKSQYEQCEDVYAESCKMGYKTYSYKDAEAACEAQYKDCLTVNKWVKDNGHCTTWDC